jgi:hypothetical protein
VQTEKDRIVAILAANLNPLVNSAYLDVHPLLNAVGRTNGHRFRICVLQVGAKREAYADEEGGDRQQAQQNQFHGLQ